MQSMVVQLEEGKENGISVRTEQYKSFRPQLLLVLGLFLAGVVTIFIVSTNKYTGLQSVVTTVTSSFVPRREEEPDGLSKWIQPHAVLMHNMSDEELLWRASFWPRRKGYPFKRVPKIAFMFLTRGPLPLASLWERFFKGHNGLYSVYIHPHPSFTSKFPADSVFYQRQIPSQLAKWGRMTMCEAERRLLANALLDISNEWFVLVSESCIHLFNFTTIYTYLSQSKHSFMDAFDDPGPFRRGRYNERMEPEVPIAKWRKGSQWFEVDRDLAATIVRDTLYHPATFGESDITENFFQKIFDGVNCTYNGRLTLLCVIFLQGSLLLVLWSRCFTFLPRFWDFRDFTPISFYFVYFFIQVWKLKHDAKVR